jgi:predicted transcriptional regulator
MNTTSLPRTDRQAIVDFIHEGDKTSTEISQFTGIPYTSIHRILNEMIEDGDIYCYRVGQNKNKRFTLDASKHTEKVKNNEIIPGARVYLLDDKDRIGINREIMQSHGNKKHKTHVGTCWEMMLSASIG